MTAAPALFRDGSTVYAADTCTPLVAAAEAGKIELAGLARGAYPGDRLPDGALPGLRSAGMWNASADQDWGLDWHRNEGLELTFLARGRLDFSCDGEDYRLEPGDLTITRPWQPHRVGAPDVTASRLTWLIVDLGVRRPNQPWGWPDWVLLPPAELSALTRRLRQNEQPVWRGSDELAVDFDRLTQALERRGARDVTRIALVTNEILLALEELLDAADAPLDAALSSSRRAVELFLAELPGRLDEWWTLDAMAAECGLRRSRFVHYCRRLTNASPLEYLLRLRLRAACDALSDRPDLRVTDIALGCGFHSSQYFATVFRRELGCSPSQYRADRV
jgi:AraC-like DNA-binding protein